MKEGKMRKFADTARTQNNQTDSSKTEATVILCGYSGERANFSSIFSYQWVTGSIYKVFYQVRQSDTVNISPVQIS